jgi:hypothetical protein
LPIISRTTEKKRPSFSVLQEIVKLTCSRRGNRSLDDEDYGIPMPPPLFDEDGAGNSRISKKELLPEPATVKPGDTITDKSLIIHSPILLNALRTVIKYSFLPLAVRHGVVKKRRMGDHIDLKTSDISGGTFPFPYTDLYYSKDDLLEYKNSLNETKLRHTNQYNSECDRHIDILVDYLYKQEKINLHQVEADWRREKPVTTFWSLFLLMRPGCDVFVKEHGCLNAYIVDGWGGGIANSDRVEEYQIVVWNLKFDGNSIVKKPKTIEIPPFDGVREITSLPLYPARFHEEKIDQPSLREQLVMRGKKFVDLAKGAAFREYNGTGLESKSKRASLSACGSTAPR